MILVSVGTQLPFDRLIKTVDAWAIRSGRDDILAQTGPGHYTPSAIKAFEFMEHERFLALQQEAELMVSHAGMGSIITALEMGKPIIVMARDHLRGEHRNGHQLSTVAHLCDRPGVYVARDEAELLSYLDRCDELVAKARLAPAAPSAFIEKLFDYIHNTPKPSRLQQFFRLFR